ncbi:arsenate reductase (glutaredoxin) [Kaustia mangrovi]|uniref:Arsenate reductase n=1 Tax=Kaustia mangrovi TaxID=2593653 RepID=A0A7S8HCE3_9HYPH|nr:arsenate reductase (glutaredoxin) [Kaustia mangrovi]QPC43530.1 arsenate reductase (glutaredoxin) [Kaustia mangrovi]
MDVTMYHNPRCSKSRETLKLLQDMNIRPKLVEYLKAPPSPDELERILKKLGKRPRDVIRRGEAPYKELGLDNPELDDRALIEAMSANPILIERPIVVAGPRAALGRPPEAVLELFR